MDINDRLYGNAVRTPAGCLEYRRYRNPKGYGQISYQNKRILTHRLSWILNNGALADDVKVLHRCDNPPCIDVEHLFVGTPAVNTADMMDKGRNRSRGSCLTRQDAEAIRQRVANGEKQKDVALDYNVTPTTVCDIIAGRTWT